MVIESGSDALKVIKSIKRFEKIGVSPQGVLLTKYVSKYKTGRHQYFYPNLGYNYASIDKRNINFNKNRAIKLE